MPPVRRPRRVRNPWEEYKKCGKMVLSDGSKALAMARGLKRLLNVEYKFLDVQNTEAAVSTTPSVNISSIILQGDGGSARDGNSVKAVGIRLNYMITLNTSAVSSQIRVILIHDKQTNGALAAAGDILQDVTADDGIVSPYNLDNKYRFRMLYDRVHTLSDNGRQSIAVKKYFKLNQKLRFDGTAGDITDIPSSSYLLLFVSNEPTNTPTITRHSRLRFIDN